MKNKQHSGKKLLSTILCGALSVSLLFSSCKDSSEITPQESSSTQLSSKKAVTGQGTDKGYFWTFWTAGNGTADMTFPNSGTYAGNFNIKYTNKSCVGGKGWATGTNTRVINYNVGYLTGSTTYDFVGVYGWTQSPLIEYYVCEKGLAAWNYTTTTGEYGESIGNNTVDGHTYAVARHLRKNGASIEGNKDFWQYLSNWGGQTFNGNKKVTMKGHTDYWKQYGGKGWGSTHNYQVFGMESFGNKTGEMNATVW